MTEAPRGLTGRWAEALRAPGASWRREWTAAAGEGRIALFAFGASLFLGLGRIAAETLNPTIAAGEDRTAWVAATLLIALSFGVLSLYFAAALIRLVCRLFGGAGGWRATRLALFWSGLVTGPLALAATIAGAAAGEPRLGAWIASALWVVWLVPMLAAAQRLPLRGVAAAFALLGAASAALALSA